MAKSGRPTLQQVRDVVRLFGDARAVIGQPALQRQIILDGSCRLVNADQGFLSEFDDFMPGRSPKGIATVGTSNLDTRVSQVIGDWLVDHAADKDAMGAAAYEAASTPGAKVICWHDVRRRETHRDFGDFHDLVETVRIADIIDPMSRHPSGNMVGMSLHRHGRGRPFNANERAVAKLIAEELEWLHQTRRLDVRTLVGDPLPPQLAAILKQLLTDKSTKQIAAQMGLSVHTAREYTKTLYRRLGVDSRERLMSSLLGTAAASYGSKKA